MQIEAVIGADALILHAVSLVGGHAQEQVLRWLHGLTVHFDEETVTVESTDAVVDDFEAMLTRRLDEIADVFFVNCGVALLHRLDDFVDGDEAELVHVETEFVGPMSQDQGHELGDASAIGHVALSVL